MENKNQLIVLVTGCAGFIGSHLCEKLLNKNCVVYGIDIINNYYDTKQKLYNLDQIKLHPNSDNFIFLNENLITTKIISKHKFDVVINLGAMAGVRFSLENPEIYIDTNIKGQVHLLKECVENKVKLFVYASSSSVYGLNDIVPFSEHHNLDKINSVYALTKKCSEDFATLYSNLYGLNVVGLRFFTVYGPRGRPDMFPYKVLNAIDSQKEFIKYGDGTSYRDYTYVDDIIDGIISSIYVNLFKCNENELQIINETYNLGNSFPVSLNDFISVCEEVVGKNAIFKQEYNQLGDVPYTYADLTKSENHFGYKPKISLKNGLTNMYTWLKEYKNIK